MKVLTDRRSAWRKFLKFLVSIRASRIIPHLIGHEMGIACWEATWPAAQKEEFVSASVRLTLPILSKTILNVIVSPPPPRITDFCSIRNFVPRFGRFVTSWLRSSSNSFERVQGLIKHFDRSTVSALIFFYNNVY